MFYSLKEKIQNVSMGVLPDLRVSPSRTTTGKCKIRFVWELRLFPLSAMIFSPAKPSNNRNRSAESRGMLDSQHTPSSWHTTEQDFKGNEFYFQILKTPRFEIQNMFQ